MINHRTARMTAVALAVASMGIAGCSTNSTNDTDTNAALAPFHAVPDGAQVVWGPLSCRDAPEGEGLALVCALEMSDPRVSGTEMIEQFQTVTSGQWIFERDVITNAEGTWQGSSQGSDDRDANPIGEAHLVGEGGYEGLEFHYYFTEPVIGEGGHLRGWISESTPAGAASATAAVTPFHAIPATSTRVSGTAACDATGSGTVDPQGELDALVTCQLDLSDPRVRGTETQDRFRILAGDVGAGDVRAADDARITTAEGTWRGRVQAATDDAAVPAAIGEAHYIGESAYEGLEFHYYFGPADLDIAEGGPVAVHGWISPAP
jgi:hypothetical protein